ncbi:MAG: YfhO family protein [Oscillospiraceae bacterium]|nr:YfhO family protein [Oscillospiraceae bacterium]
MQKNSTPVTKSWKERLEAMYFWEILAFVIPFLLMGYAFKKIEIHPFGDRQILVTDAWHQYYPFFQLLFEKLKNGESLLYSFRTGIGTNFLSLMAYYAASPLNFLSVFMKQENLRDGLTVILLLKFSFAGFFMAKCVKYLFGKNDISVTMFGVMYALCSYMMGYYWNIIWIDTVALLPLVMTGLAMLVREGKYRLYVLSLALALYTNYYIAYFICIYTVLAFFCLCLYENLNFKKFIKRFGMITGCSLLGAGISAWILLPTFFALQLTYSANNKFPTSIKFYEKWRDLIANMMAYTEPTTKTGLPNLYCGLLPVLLLGAFLIAKKIRIREKITAVLLLVFLILSCNINYLNFIWHGFHFTNMIPYRFSFLFSFTMLIMAYRAYQVLLEEKLSLWQWGAMLVTGGIFCGISYTSGVQEDDGHKFVTSCIYLGAVYLIVIFCRKFAPKQIIQTLLACVIAFEMSGQAIRGADTVGSSGYGSYPADNADMQTLIAQQDDSDLFHRSEITMWYTLNDPSLYYYNGISQFSSMANEDISIFCRKMALPASEGSNRYFYANTAPLTHMMLDVRYVLAKDGYSSDTFSMHKVANTDKCAMFENDYILGLGFMMPETMADYELPDQDDPFQTQNELFKKLTGVNEDLYTQIDITHVGHHGFDVTRKAYGFYNYTKQDDASEYYLKYNYTTVQDGMAYAYAKVKNGDNMEVRVDNGDLIHKYSIGRQPYITPLGSYPAGTLINLKCTMKDEAKSGDVNIYFYQMNEDVWKKGYEAIQNGGLTLTEFSDTKINGTVNSEKDGILYLSIPYEKGWSVWVDGQKADLLTMFGAMSGVRVTAGSHEIALKYSPRGFVPGIMIGICCITILVLLYFYEKKHPQNEETETPEEDTPQTETSETAAVTDAFITTENPDTPETVPEAEENPETPAQAMTESQRIQEQDQDIFDFIDSYYESKKAPAPENPDTLEDVEYTPEKFMSDSSQDEENHE